MEANGDTDWFQREGLLWEAATLDAAAKAKTPDENTANVAEAMLEFASSGEVHDREEFYSFLDRVKNGQGNFLLVLGGKSVGKSLILKDFAANLEASGEYLPLYVDGRLCSSEPLYKGIVSQYQNLFELKWGRLSLSEEEAIKFLKAFANVFSDFRSSILSLMNDEYGSKRHLK